MYRYYMILTKSHSFCFMVVSITPAQYFKSKRGIANGIVYAAGGLGGAVISFVLNALLDSMGTAWTFRILGFITLGSGLPAAYLIKQRVPIPPTQFVEWYVNTQLVAKCKNRSNALFQATTPRRPLRPALRRRRNSNLPPSRPTILPSPLH